ncbi:choline-sulfatase [Derxia gummosa]|uniref:Choline-sulfatase n=1 Tax=Derxia gummosa DSM 723 TaxID=1121388 RepID=A0A8B6X4D7_9BURK|nr:choline-sulfatase [Derxia gummosa]
MSADPARAASPNFLVLIADQLTPFALRPWGNRVVRTPNIDRLATSGAVFESAYCPSPLCAPSRFGLLSGLLPSRFGGFDNACEMPSEIPTVAHHLRSAGYRTILSGKMHFAGPNQLHGFEERLTTDIYPADFGWTPDWRDPDGRPEWYHNPSSVIQAGPAVRTNQLDFDDEVVFKARRKLFDLARGNDRRPFLLTVSMTHPHDPYVIAREYWDRHADADIDDPKLGANDIADDAHSARLRRACQFDITPLTREQIRRARRAYYGAISYVDDKIGELLSTLEATGAADNTVIVLLSDHGDMLGERGLWYKMHFFEPAIRVPMLFHAPARFAARRIGGAVSTLDLLPTLTDIAGAPLPAGIDGRSLLPALLGATPPAETFAEYLGEGAIAPMAMIRRDNFKFIHSPADPDLLFDLAADPLETRNLAGDAHFSALVAQFRAEAGSRWDFAELESAVLASQQRRRFVHAAESRGQRSAWDYQPPDDASRQYVRSHMELDAIEAMARFPAWQSGGN